MLATDFRRLAAAYNSALLRPGQPALGAQARRLNDAELVTAAANVEKNMDAFRNAYDSALAANTNLTPASRQSAIQNVDAMKNSARALQRRAGEKAEGHSGGERAVEGERGHDRRDAQAPTELLGGCGVGSGSRGAVKSRVGL